MAGCEGPVFAFTAVWFEDLVVLADVVAGTYQVSGVCDDPDDDKYLAAAVEGRAAYVVTGDRGFLAVGEHAGVQLVTPRAFLDVLEPRGRRRSDLAHRQQPVGKREPRTAAAIRFCSSNSLRRRSISSRERRATLR